MKLWSNISKFKQRVNFQTNNSEIRLRKDHEAIPPLSEELVSTPDSCMWCYWVSYCISSVIRPIIEFVPESCNSTDNLLSRINELKNQDYSDSVIGSMDFETLSTSIDIDFIAEKWLKLLYEISFMFKNEDINKLGLYLALCMEPVELESKGNSSVLFHKKTESNEQKWWSCYNWCQLKPNEAERTKMVSARATLKNRK